MNTHTFGLLRAVSALLIFFYAIPYGSAANTRDGSLKMKPPLAFCIGIDQYQIGNNLTRAVGDAYGAREALKNLGSFRQAEFSMQTDSEGGTTLGALRRVLATLEHEKELRSAIVVYYSGHGFVDAAG